MRGTLVFVHGTGVRQAGYDATLHAIQDGCRRTGLNGISIEGAPWGPKLGVPLNAVANALPAGPKTRDALGPPELSDPDIETSLWQLLLDDPLFELRLAGEAEASERSGEVVVGGSLPDQAADDVLRRVERTPPDVAGSGLAPSELTAAAGAVVGTEELHAAATAVGDAADPDLIEAMARAVTATALAAHRLDEPGTEPAAAVSGAAREDVVEALVTALAPDQTKGLGGWLKRKVTGFAAQRATAAIFDRRAALQGSSTPGLGDILFYQRRGEATADFVRDHLVGRARPVVALGHSLGGIVLVDLLSRPDAPPVDLLVTVGSQSPMFYAIDALERLRPGSDVAPFSPWLNIYNPRDFLSFVTRRIWPDATGLTDAEVDPRVPFPASHSAYFQADRTYELIRDAWPD